MMFPLLPPLPAEVGLLTAVKNLIISGLVKIMFLISWLLKSSCETKRLMRVLIVAVLWDPSDLKAPETAPSHGNQQT